MKKQLLIRFMVVICICAVTMGTVSLIFTSNEYRGNTKAELLTFCTMFNDAYEQGEEEQLVDSFAKSTGARVTLLDKDGRVRKDSQVEIEENHGAGIRTGERDCGTVFQNDPDAVCVRGTEIG